MRIVLFAASIIIAVTAFAQEAPKATAAIVNGEIITAEKLDALYASIPVAMRDQYEKSGGKKLFLDNYIAKRLLIQEAMKSGFDERPDVKAAVEAARESTLFDRYIREVIAADVLPESEIHKFYDDNIKDFHVGDQVKVRHIVIGTGKRSKEEALRTIEPIFAELQALRITYPPQSEGSRELFSRRFADVARRHSEDGVAPEGGDLGWVSRGQLDPEFEKTAFAMPAGVMSGIVASQFGYHVILVDDKKPAGPRPYEEVRRDIREHLLGQKQAQIMTAVSRLTGELRRTSKVAVYPENVD